MKKKILININTTWNIFNFRLSLIKELQNNGHEIIAVAPKDKYVDELEAIGVKCFNIKLKPQGTNPIIDLNLIIQYYKLFKIIKPDIVLSYTIKPNVYGNFALCLLGIPVINNISGLGTVFIKNSFTTSIVKFLYKLILRSSTHVFFQNEKDQNLFIKLNIIKFHKCSVIPGSGVNVEKFNCERTKNPGNKYLFVGRLISDKGVIEYLESAVSIIKYYPNKEFLLCGELDYDNKTAISIKELKYYTDNYSQIKYLGKTDNIVKLLSEIDVMVLPSYREGLSKSLIEAAAMSLPIITTNVPGCKEVVEDGLNGFLCELKSRKSLENAILKMINLSNDKRLQMGLNGRLKIINTFTDEIVNNIYLNKINKILKIK
jgi:glycosyltransferase involved in cell wall biosynthesis